MSTPLSLPDTWLPLSKSDAPLRGDVLLSAVAQAVAVEFDCDPLAHPFTPWRAPNLPLNYGIGLIVGASGSGKSTLLSEFGTASATEWRPGVAIADHFETPAAAMTAFYAVGLSSVPTWLRPADCLSTGERFRADLARSLVNGAVVDEYTSVVDRTVAAAASRSLRSHVDAGACSQMTLATCHRDVIPWLRPDWIVDTDSGTYAINPRECLQRPPLVVDVYEVTRAMWAHFMGHHYLTGKLHPFARCYVGVVSGQPAAFGAAIPFPHASIRNAWRETRLVTLPEFQGLGVGPRLSDWIAEAHRLGGYNYYSKTTHGRLGAWRDRSPAWSSTSHNRRTKPGGRGAVSFGTRTENAWVGSTRSSYSHKYVGAVEVGAA